MYMSNIVFCVTQVSKLIISITSYNLINSFIILGEQSIHTYAVFGKAWYMKVI